MKLLLRNRMCKCLLAPKGSEAIFLDPGVNEVAGADWDAISKLPSVKRMLAEGELEVISLDAVEPVSEPVAVEPAVEGPAPRYVHKKKKNAGGQ